MKSLLKIVLKTIGGGFVSVFFILLWQALKDVFNFFSQGVSCEDLIFIPVKLFLGMIIVTSWDDWSILFFVFGSLFVLIFQVMPLLSAFVQKNTRQLFIALQATLLLIFGLGILLETREELAIENRYNEYCRAVKDHNYVLAYSYFSPDYRSKVSVNRFVEEIVSLDFSFNCGEKFWGTISHRLRGAYLYPFPWSNTACSLFLGGSQFVLIRIDGKWYFTGEHTWFMGM